MKTIFLAVLMVLVASSFVGAATITTQINISTDAGFATVSAEGWAASYNCNQTATNNRITSIERNFENNELANCRTALSNITLTMQSLSESFKDSKAYYPLYTECFSNLTLCRNEGKLLSEKVTGRDLAEEQKRSCTEQLGKTDAERIKKENDLIDCQKIVGGSDEKIKKLEGNKWLWAAGGAILVGVYTYFRYEKKTTGQTQIDKDMPMRK